jgi:hypothetical protein
MNDLYKALGDINSIRKKMASSTEFRGYEKTAGGLSRGLAPLQV